MGSLFSGPTTTTNSSFNQQSNQTGTSAQQGTSQQSATGNTSQAGSNTQTGNTTGNFSQTSTPNLPSWYNTFLQQIPQQFGQLAQTFSQNAAKPLYGQQQQANFQNQLAGSQRASQQTLNSQLASQGALNSGRAGQMDTQLALGGQGELANYLAQVPGMNAQYQTQQLQGLQNATNGMAGFTSPINAYGATTSGQNSQQQLQNLISSILGTSNQNQTGATTQNGQTSAQSNTSGNSQSSSSTSGGFMNSLLNAGLGYLTGGASTLLSGLFNGLGSGSSMMQGANGAVTDLYQNMLNNPGQGSAPPPPGGYMGGGLY